MARQPEKRKVHIKRIKGVRLNDAGEPIETEDFYIDMARMDEVVFSLRASRKPDDPRRIKVKRKLKWFDRPEDVGTENEKNSTRKRRTLKIYDPENPPDDVENPVEYVPVEIIEECTVKLRGRPGKRGQKVKLIFKNDPKDEQGTAKAGRVVNKTRITFREVSDALNEILNTGEIVDLSEYQKSETNDPTQYIDAEVIKDWKKKTNRPERKRIKSVYQIADYAFDQERPENPDPPSTAWRFDPFQNPINVKWGLPTGLIGAGTGYSSSTTYDAIKFNLQTGAAGPQLSSIGKGNLGFGSISCACIDYEGNIIVGEPIVAAQPTDFGPTGWTAGMLIHKYSKTGSQLWAMTAPGLGTYAQTQRHPTGIGVDKQNNIYMAENYHPQHAPTARGYVRKYSPEGAELWEVDLGSGSQAYTWGIMVLPDGGCIVPYSAAGLLDPTLRRLDAEGIQVWDVSVDGFFMSGVSGHRIISQKSSAIHFALNHGSWFTQTPTVSLFNVEDGSIIWSHAYDGPLEENYGVDIGGKGEAEAVFVCLIDNDGEDSFSIKIHKLSITTGALVDQVTAQSGITRSPNTGYPIVCTGDVVATMIHDHTEIDVPFYDRWDEYNFSLVCYKQADLQFSWIKPWGLLSGELDNELGPYSVLSNLGRAPG